ncbi:MAG: PilW family protein [Proteobacteria bacterium]|nr:PilW family protein [Pseudomonadota bacterium]
MISRGSIAKKYIRGFGLLEIIVSIIIIMILTIGFVYVMLNQSKAFQVENNLTQLQRRNHLGFAKNNHAPDFRVSGVTQHQEPLQDFIQFIPADAKIVAGTSANVNNSDTLTITYPITKSNMFSCMATTGQQGQMVDTLFYVTENHELACANIKDKIPNTGQKDVIIEGVEAMRIRYGEDTDNDGSVNRYVAADYPGLSLARVINIKLSLLLRTPEKANLMLDSKYYTLQDVELGPYKDNYVRKVYTTTLPMTGFSQEHHE